MPFRAVYLTLENERFDAHMAVLDEASLPADGDVTVRIAYSTLNYKDALALTNSSPVVRTWPMVPGIDGAGVIQDSNHPSWRAGDRVVLNGFGVGETHWGCLSEKARLRGDWLVSLPRALDERAAMSIGTAGYTAMLACMALSENGITPARGEVLVTGATGGVGSIAVMLLSARGYRVIAATGKMHDADYLRGLGAADVIDRRSLSDAGKPLQKERWAGVVDALGSHALANACAQTQRDGVVVACGLAQGMDFPVTVAPFILRGVRLIGIDSVMCPIERRRQAWTQLAQEIDVAKLEAMTRTIELDACFDAARALMQGQMRGRYVVRVSA